MGDHDRRGNEGAGSAGSAVLWFAVGACVGAAAGVIFAPAAGRETRASLGQQGRTLADECGERGRQAASALMDQGRQLWEECGERVVSAMKRAGEGAPVPPPAAGDGGQTT